MHAASNFGDLVWPEFYFKSIFLGGVQAQLFITFETELWPYGLAEFGDIFTDQQQSMHDALIQ